MRVLETDSSITYKMGKSKRHRIRKAKENEAEESSDDAQQGCSHVTKAVNLAAMRKTVQKLTTSLGECTLCSKEAPKGVATRDLFGDIKEGPSSAGVCDGEDGEVHEPTVCICLQCGHQGCDRNSANKCALKHYKTPHSSLHCIIVNLSTWSTWCYACDEEVPPGPRIQGCIDFLYRQTVQTKPEPFLPFGRTESPSPEASPNTYSSKSYGSCVKVKGLSNLGNTCFFNAVMQSICQTRGLESLLTEWGKQGKMCTIPGPELVVESGSESSESDGEGDACRRLPSIQTSYPDPGPITTSLLHFLQEMKGGTTRNNTVNPNILFTQVCKKAPRFKGFQQQDSHELLRYMIDCIRIEEIKRGQSSILKLFKLPETINPKKVDEDTKVKIKEYGRQVKHTFLDSLFGGQLVSTVRCEECKNASQVYESFLDLSLPVMEEKPQRPNLVFIGKKKDGYAVGGGEAGGGGPSSAASGMGLDFNEKSVSKYQERKNKRLLKKENKKKSKGHKWLSQDSQADAGTSGKTEVGDKPGTPEGDKPGTPEGDKPGTPEGDKHGIPEADKPGSPDCDNPTVSDDGCKLTDNATSSLGPKLSNEKSCDVLGADSEKDSTGIDTGRRDTADSSQEGSKDGLDGKPDLDLDSSSHDPSDADIEDNLETDMSRLELSAVGDVANGKSEVNGSVNVETAGSSIRCDEAANNCGHPTDEPPHAHHINNSGVELKSVNSEKGVLSNSSSKQTNCEENNVSEVGGLVNGFHSLSCNEASKVNNLSKVHNNNSDSNATCNANAPVVVPSVSEVVLPVLNGEANSCGGGGGGGCGVDKLSTSSLPDGEVKHKAGPTESKDKHLVHKSHKSRRQWAREARSYSMSTLAPRYQPAPRECSIMSCLNQFTAAELLTGSNKVSCKECTKAKRKNSLPKPQVNGDKKTKDTVYSNSNKQYLIFRPPAVLTLHLKRFEQTGLTSRKVNRHVEFPLLLDLAPYCSSLSVGVCAGQSRVLYGLYGVVEHSGRLSGGHYTAYIKVRPGLSPQGQFLHANPPSASDLLNMYMERVVRLRGDNKLGPCGGHDAMDVEVEAKAECMVPPGRWFHISDSRVNEVTESEVLKAQAYLLFYERTL